MVAGWGGRGGGGGRAYSGCSECTTFGCRVLGWRRKRPTPRIFRVSRRVAQTLQPGSVSQTYHMSQSLPRARCIPRRWYKGGMQPVASSNRPMVARCPLTARHAFDGTPPGMHAVLTMSVQAGHAMHGATNMTSLQQTTPRWPRAAEPSQLLATQEHLAPENCLWLAPSGPTL